MNKRGEALKQSPIFACKNSGFKKPEEETRVK